MAEKLGTTETQHSSSNTESPASYTFFMLIKTTTRWLQAPESERVAFMKAEVMPLLKRWPNVTLRYYDAEFFTTRCTDVMVWETENLLAYQALIEKLRDTLFWDTYFEIVEIIPAVEVAYANLGDAPVVGLATS
jgi:Darcynin, domain of unknown function